MSSSSSLDTNELYLDCSLNSFNLDANSEAEESLKTLLSTEYPLDFLKKTDIRMHTEKYVRCRLLGYLARSVIRKIDALERKEKEAENRKRAHCSAAPSTASPPENKKRCPEGLKKTSPTLMPESFFTSKRTMPVKFVPKNKAPVKMTPVLPAIPIQPKPLQPHNQKNRQNEEMKKLQKFQEMKHAERVKEAQKKEKAAKEGVKQVMNVIERQEKRGFERHKKPREPEFGRKKNQRKGIRE